MAHTDCPKCQMAEVHCTCGHYPLNHHTGMATYKEEYLKLKSICSGIYYARIAMREDLVFKGLKDIDNYFREPNMN
jgi:hypothetical protein